MLRLLFGPPDSPIDRQTYLRVGVSLMALKYAVDAAAIAIFAGVFWTPADYLLPMISFNAAKMAQFPQALNLFLLLWTLPFLWIGVVLSARRAIDADVFPGIVVTFFVPFLNYLLMAALAIAPSRAPRPPRGFVMPERPVEPLLDSSESGPSTGWGILSGAVAGVFAVVFGVMVLKTYGAAVFLGAPFMTGMVSALVANRIAPRSRRHTLMIGLGALAAIAGVIIFMALEGAICLIMAFPIAAPIAMMGSLTGQLLAHRGQPPSLGHLTLMLLAVPLGAGIEAALPGGATRTVLTAVEIDAPAATVWRHVVSFGEIERRPAWYFRTGLAYPLRARLEGTGVGAVRHCEFTTGAFVEPITVWDEPRVLAFDVMRQPPPLREWSPYSRVYAPHLDGFFQTSRGEFRLIQLSPTRTRLEGRTWYSLDMQPSIYWNLIADGILHAIHARVLEHVKSEAQKVGAF
jgi:hypothetical protein